jgi:uncharacterized protein YndB with AHSA1/START domain
MSEDPRAVVVEVDLDAPTETVWRAFADPRLSSDWLAKGAIATTPGERFSLDDEGRRIDCEVLEAEPGRRLRLGWRDADDAVASEVSFVFIPTPAGGTRLRITHGPVLARFPLPRRAPARSVTAGAWRMAA